MESWDEVPAALRRTGRKGGLLCATMFPPADPKLRADLRHCVRILPCHAHGLLGGFFVAAIERLPKEADSDASSDANAELCSQPREEPSEADSKDRVGGLPVKRKAPPRPLLRQVTEDVLGQIEDFWGFFSCAEAAAAHGVQVFPREAIRVSAQGYIVFASPLLASIVQRKPLPVVEMGMSLFAGEGWRPFPEAASTLAAWSAHRVLRLSVSDALLLLEKGLEAQGFQAGGAVVSAEARPGQAIWHAAVLVDSVGMVQTTLSEQHKAALKRILQELAHVSE